VSAGSDAERASQALERLDTSVAHIARVYDYWLGGKDNFTADRAAGEATMAVYPGIRLSAQANRAFLARAVRHLAGTEGIRQFPRHRHRAPHREQHPRSGPGHCAGLQIVYVDNDPLVLAHARALLTSTAEGATAYLDADLRDTGKILARAAATLDFSQPVAIMLIAILHYVEDPGQARQIVARLLDAVPSGSFLVITHAGIDLFPEEIGPFEKVLNQHLPVITMSRDARHGDRALRRGATAGAGGGAGQ